MFYVINKHFLVYNPGIKKKGKPLLNSFSLVHWSCPVFSGPPLALKHKFSPSFEKGPNYENTDTLPNIPKELCLHNAKADRKKECHQRLLFFVVVVASKYISRGKNPINFWKGGLFLRMYLGYNPNHTYCGGGGPWLWGSGESVGENFWI